jgi:hypothetical protein
MFEHTGLPEVVGRAVVRSLASAASDDGMGSSAREVHDLLDRILGLHKVDKVLDAHVLAHVALVVARVDADDAVAETVGEGAAHGADSSAGAKNDDPLALRDLGALQGRVNGGTAVPWSVRVAMREAGLTST